MNALAELEMLRREAARRGYKIDFDVVVGDQDFPVYEIAEKLGGTVSANGDIWFGDHGRLIFTDSGHRLEQYYTNDPDERKALDRLLRKRLGLAKGQKLTTKNDALLKAARSDDAARNNASAKELWSCSVPIEGSPAEKYLRNRGITLPLPEALRFNPKVWHSEDRSEVPAMAALPTDPVTRGAIGGIHLTSLVPVSARKKWTRGAYECGIIRLAEPAGRIAIAEGIETALSFMQLFNVPAWAAINAGNVKKVKIPPEVRHVIIAADNDRPNDRGFNTGMQQAAFARDNFRCQGKTVEIITTKAAGVDWNDVLVRRARHG